jgi:small subunit ribosomal protein S20
LYPLADDAIVPPFLQPLEVFSRMANTKSQKKRNRQNEKARVRNRAVRSELKTRNTNTMEAAASGDADAANAALRDAQKRIDMAASKGLLHKSTASRRKSRLAKQVARTLG